MNENFQNHLVWIPKVEERGKSNGSVDVRGKRRIFGRYTVPPSMRNSVSERGRLVYTPLKDGQGRNCQTVTEDAVKLLHFKLCPVCHRILKTDDVLVLVEHLREIGYFYGNGQEADVCGVNLVDPKLKRRQAELSPAKRLRRAGLSHEEYLNYLEDRVPSDNDDIQEYSPLHHATSRVKVGKTTTSR
ncbi:hypothetical protein AVEN_17537-1 [Araneus ventricosus]|uniref:Uncharacterized protein n=1 Tax=Araneus ventricosus TaxID=182803 RepID=A0A4Y2HF90_ARAVE|nr:hypothetical protein AVEN_17537-1 [Araneus ventricosus]